MADWQWLSTKVQIAIGLKRPPNLPAHGWSYFQHLAAVYEASSFKDPTADGVIAKAEKFPGSMTWADVFLLENMILKGQPDDVLRRNAWIIRERFREITSSTIYDKYIQSDIPKDTATPAGRALLRADLGRIQDVLHWHYSLIPIREQIKKTLTRSCIWWIFFYTLVLGISLIILHCKKDSFLAMLLCVLYFGIIGGFVSSQRRMQNIPTDTDPLINIFGLDSAGYYLWISPLLGGIFAIVLSLMFIAGTIKGSVFPDFYVPKAISVSEKNTDKGTEKGTEKIIQSKCDDQTSDNCDKYVSKNPKKDYSLYDGFSGTLPKGTEEWAKLFIWAFLAGFAERLVPDSLDKLASKLNSNSNPGFPAAPNSTPSKQNGGSSGQHSESQLRSEEITEEATQSKTNSS